MRMKYTTAFDLAQRCSAWLLTGCAAHVHVPAPTMASTDASAPLSRVCHSTGDSCPPSPAVVCTMTTLWPVCRLATVTSPMKSCQEMGAALMKNSTLAGGATSRDAPRALRAPGAVGV